MNLFVLELGPPDPVTGLPSKVGEANQRTHGAGEWHVHNGGWTADSQTLVFTLDKDEGDIYELLQKD
jgi:hypothetical protein